MCVLAGLRLNKTRGVYLTLFSNMTARRVAATLVANTRKALVPVIGSGGGIVLVNSLLQRTAFSDVERSLTYLGRLVHLLEITGGGRPNLVIRARDAGTNILKHITT